MTPNEEKENWHHLGATKLSALLQGKTSKNSGGFYCLICLYFLENKLKSYLKYVKIKSFVEF